MPERSQKTEALLLISALILILGGAFFMIYDAAQHHEIKNDSSKNEMIVAAKFTGTQFVIANQNDFDWYNIKFKINPGWIDDGYYYELSSLKAGQNITIGALQFAKRDGIRLNPLLIKPQNIEITCQTPYGSKIYNAEWK